MDTPDASLATVAERVAEIQSRYGPDDLVARFIRCAMEDLSGAVERTDRRLEAAMGQTSSSGGTEVGRRSIDNTTKCLAESIAEAVEPATIVWAEDTLERSDRYGMAIGGHTPGRLGHPGPATAGVTAPSNTASAIPTTTAIRLMPP